MTFQSQTLFIMFCVLILPWLLVLNSFLFKGELAQGQCKRGLIVWGPRVNEIISSDRCNSATEIHNISFWSLHSSCAWSSAAFPYLLLHSLDHLCVCSWWPKAASLIFHIFRRNRVGNNSLPETQLALRLLNITPSWTDWFYLFSLYGITFQLLDPFGLRLLCCFFIFPLRNSVSSIWTFSFHCL